jgi:molybdate transport system substrate-binding protein
MRFGSYAAVAAIAAVALLAHGSAALAADIKVLSVVPLKTTMDMLGPQFEAATGHKLVIAYGGSDQIKRRVENGEEFDVAVAFLELIEDLIKQGKLVADSRKIIASVPIAVAVKKGAPKPDISTVDAFKRTLLNAKSISHSAEGGSGIYFKGLIERLGIAAELKSKLRPINGATLVVPAVVKGEADIAVITTPYIAMEPGADLVGALPGELQQLIVYTAGISSAARQAGAAKALITHLTTPEAAKLLKSKGLDPPAP